MFTFRKKAPPPNLELSMERLEDGVLRLRPQGRLSAMTTAHVWGKILAEVHHLSPQTIHFDASGLSYCDNVGVALILFLRHRQESAGKVFQLSGLSSEYEHLLDLYKGMNLSRPEAPREPESLALDLGMRTSRLWWDIKSLVGFVGELSCHLAHAIRHPRSVRWADVFQVAEVAGVNALPLVGLVSFLVGLILAFQSTIPMRQFDLEIYASNLVALSMLRELGPLMTAIILAGRTGSAFAAEIGTMQVNEEVNALRTMGIDPVSFLVTPRVIAASIVTPLLTVFANLMGLVGGAIVILSLGYPLITFWLYVESAVTYVDLIGGLVKAFAFGILVAGVGCLRGLQTGPGARSVGVSTTSAVVSAIVLIVLADFVFSLVYFQLGI